MWIFRWNDAIATVDLGFVFSRSSNLLEGLLEIR